VVVPVDVLGYSDLQVVNPVPRSLVPDQLGLEQRIQRLGHRIIIGITDRSDRRDRLDVGESFCVAHRRVLHTAVGMMNEIGQVTAGVLTGPDAHVKRIECEVGVEVRGQLPTHDPPREHIEHERRVHPPGERPHVRYVGHPQLIRSGRGELAVDQVRAGVRAGAAAGRGRRLHPRHPAQTSGLHEPTDGAPGHVPTTDAALAAELCPHLLDSVHAVILPVHPPDLS